MPVPENHVKSVIDGNIRQLKCADHQPTVFLPHKPGSKNPSPAMMVVRDGNSELLPISRRVAEELIAMGLCCGS